MTGLDELEVEVDHLPQQRFCLLLFALRLLLEVTRREPLPGHAHVDLCGHLFAGRARRQVLDSLRVGGRQAAARPSPDRHGRKQRAGLRVRLGDPPAGSAALDRGPATAPVRFAGEGDFDTTPKGAPRGPNS